MWEGGRVKEVNEKAVQDLAFEIGILVRGHLSGHAPDRARVYEVLNALAIQVAVMLAATGPSEEAMRFFHGAVANQMSFLEEAQSGRASITGES